MIKEEKKSNDVCDDLIFFPLSLALSLSVVVSVSVDEGEDDSDGGDENHLIIDE